MANMQKSRDERRGETLLPLFSSGSVQRLASAAVYSPTIHRFVQASNILTIPLKKLHYSIFHLHQPYTLISLLTPLLLCYLPIFHRQLIQHLSMWLIKTHMCTPGHLLFPLACCSWMNKTYLLILLQSSDQGTHMHTCKRAHTHLRCIVKSHLWQNMRNLFQSVAATFGSKIIIQCNWYTLWNVLVFDLGPLKVSYSDSLVTDMLEIRHSILNMIFLFQKRQNIVSLLL